MDWRHFFRLPEILTKGEKYFLAFGIILFLGSSAYLLLSYYRNITEARPTFGGTYTEGIVGQPRFLNPIYSQASDADRDLVELLFAGLLKYDASGKIAADLAELPELQDGGKRYEFTLKEARWQDGQKISADDVIFTIKTIQDPSYQSPLRGNWLGVQVEKISENKISLALTKPYAAFPELATVKIIPRHIWQNITPENFPLSNNNLANAVGSGPYLIKKIEQSNSGIVEKIALEANPKYFGKKPFLKTAVFVFFGAERDLLGAAQAGAIDGFAPSMAKNYSLSNFVVHRLVLLRYFAVFLNDKGSGILAQKKIREALQYGTNKEEIVKNVFGGSANAISSPVLPNIFGLKEPAKTLVYDREKAKELLSEAGFKINPETNLRQKILIKEPALQLKSDLQVGSQGKEVEALQKCLAKDPQIYPEGTVNGNFGQQTKAAVIRFQEKYRADILIPAGISQGNGKVGPATRQKINQLCLPKTEEIIPLTVNLVTAAEPPLSAMAELLRSQWKEIGIDLKIQEVPAQELMRDFIRPRNYQTLLFGQVLGATPDPLPFWHSSQTMDPGLNLTSFESRQADNELALIRESDDEEERRRTLEDFQDVLLEDSPAVFLAQPEYLYFVSPKIKGINGHIITDPSKRFAGIENWYIKTRRAF